MTIAKRRAAAAAWSDAPRGVSYLRARSITAEARARYEETAAEFLAYVDGNGLPAQTPEQADAALEKFCNAQFLLGEGANYSSSALRGLCWIRHCAGDCGALGKARARGARSGSGGGSRHVRLLLVAVRSVAVDSLLGVRADAAEWPVQQMGVLRENEKASKTGTFDDSIIVGDAHPARQWVAHVLPLLLRRGQHELFVPLQLAQLEAVRDAAAELNLQALKICPHMCRHGGPLTDVLGKHVLLTEVQARGRWSAPQSVRRYEKHAKLLRVIAKTPMQVMIEGAYWQQRHGSAMIAALRAALKAS